MARTRTLKPSFFRSQSLAKCSKDARLMFAGLLVVADYCRTCGCSVCSWGCSGGERVYWHDRPVSATMDGKSDARSTDSAVRHSGHLEQKEPAPMRHVTHTVNPPASQAT